MLCNPCVTLLMLRFVLCQTPDADWFRPAALPLIDQPSLIDENAVLSCKDARL
jgi:hypothetical protein